jgi:hypothetical protein
MYVRGKSIIKERVPEVMQIRLDVYLCMVYLMMLSLVQTSIEWEED